MPEKLYRLDLWVEEKDYDKMLGLLALEAPYGWEEQSRATGETVFRLHSENGEILKKLGDMAQNLARDIKSEFSSLDRRDWLEAWREFFTPVLCGNRFVVLPPWDAGKDFGDRTKLLIEPKSAFGTGHHATTALCLAAISDLADSGKIGEGQSFLDVGCGSGILSIAANKCRMNGLGLDIDQLAIDNALENRTLNGAHGVEFALGSVERAADKAYDLVMANILAGPLVEMAGEIAATLKEGGILILSGILDIQIGKVENAYLAEGLRKMGILEEGEWRALVFAK